MPQKNTNKGSNANTPQQQQQQHSTATTSSSAFIPIPPTPSVRHHSNTQTRPHGLMKLIQEPVSLRYDQNHIGSHHSAKQKNNNNGKMTIAAFLRQKNQQLVRKQQQQSSSVCSSSAFTEAQLVCGIPGGGGYVAGRGARGDLIAGGGGGGGGSGLYDPRDWRERVAFHVPTNPEIMMAHADDLVHSQSLKYTNDRGMRLVNPVTLGSGKEMFGHPYATSTISLQRDKGVVGMSLRKYSTNCMESDSRSYPGVVQHPVGRYQSVSSLPRNVQESLRAQYYNIHPVF